MGTMGWVILGSEGEGLLTSCASNGYLEGDGIHVLLTWWRVMTEDEGMCKGIQGKRGY
jgi:hypothetical protein